MYSNVATHTPLGARDAAAIARAHRLGEVRRVTGVELGTRNSNYILETDRERVFVRLYETQGADAVAFEWRMLEHLHRAGAPVSRRLAGRAPGLCRVAGRPVGVFELFEGAPVRQAAVEVEHTRAVGEALARIHVGGRTLRDRPLSAFGRAPASAAFERIEAARRPELIDTLARLRALAESLDAVREGLPRGLIHGDLFRQNALWHAGQLTGVVDWDAAGDDVLAFDLMITVLAWSVGDALDWTLAAALVDGYARVRPLTDAEWLALRELGRLACLELATSRIVSFYLSDRWPDSFKSYGRFMMRLDTLEALSPAELIARLRAPGPRLGSDASASRPKASEPGSRSTPAATEIARRDRGYSG
jgi:homoserine kinase type II